MENAINFYSVDAEGTETTSIQRENANVLVKDILGVTMNNFVWNNFDFVITSKYITIKK